jgi:hypothetical protein
MTTTNEKNEFLEEDLTDALKWLFVGAVAWQATDPKENQPERCCHQKVLAMYTSLVQARALYEFYYDVKPNRKPDDARVRDFAPSWVVPKRHYYSKYMDGGAPANKRVFHLVYGRNRHSGGRGGSDESEDLKNQVLAFAKELREITEEFVKCAEPQFVRLVQAALENGLNEAESVAGEGCFNIANPL